MSDVYQALGSYAGPLDDGEVSEVANKKKATLSLDMDDIKQELLKDREFMRHLQEMEKMQSEHVAKGPLVPYGGENEVDPQWKGGERMYLPLAPDDKAAEGDYTRGAVIREAMKRKAARAFENKFGRPPNELEYSALYDAMRKSMIDYGQDIEDPPWEKYIESGDPPRKI